MQAADRQTPSIVRAASQASCSGKQGGRAGGHSGGRRNRGRRYNQPDRQTDSQREEHRRVEIHAPEVEVGRARGHHTHRSIDRPTFSEGHPPGGDVLETGVTSSDPLPVHHTASLRGSPSTLPAASICRHRCCYDVVIAPLLLLGATAATVVSCRAILALLPLPTHNAVLPMANNGGHESVSSPTASAECWGMERGKGWGGRREYVTPAIE
mmetsp:Transcript_26286/g.65340  ORF Transcript_26286/g.65340 Transcript_26286/m.65340 type:complete len:211 (+) Transcript_26286:446-1078(+)